jgi:hypothetical protein
MEFFITTYIVFGVFALVGAIGHLCFRIDIYKTERSYKGAKTIAKNAHWVLIAAWLVAGAFVWPLLAVAALFYYPFKLVKHSRSFFAQVNADRRGAEA